MVENRKVDKSHQVLSRLAEDDVEQPGDTPSDLAPKVGDPIKQGTEDAPRESD